MSDEPIQGGLLEVHEGMFDDCEIHVAHYLLDQMTERGMTLPDLAYQMRGDPSVNWCALEFLFVNRHPGMTIGREYAEDFARIFGTSVGLWLRLDRSYRHRLATGKPLLGLGPCDCIACKGFVDCDD